MTALIRKTNFIRLSHNLPQSQNIRLPNGYLAAQHFAASTMLLVDMANTISINHVVVASDIDPQSRQNTDC